MTKNMYVIAEIGTSHCGDIKKAKMLIDAAKQGGADCVKFQWVYAKEILHPNTGIVKLPTGDIPLYKRFTELEVKPHFFKIMKKYAHSKGLDFCCSPFGIKSLKQLWAIKPDCIKIASPELNHFPLLKKLVQLENKSCKKIPIILSSGVSKEKDIKKAINVFDSIKRNKPIKTANNTLQILNLLHCITSYPAPENEYNLAVINTLQNKFNLPVGISDHSLSPLIVPSVGVFCNAKIIEKHITLSNQTDGLDDPVALTAENFLLMTKSIKKYENFSESDCLNELYAQFTKKTVTEVIGSGIKELAPSEEQNYKRTNRSIHFVHDMKKNQKIKKSDIAVLRTEKVLSVGISPEYYKAVIGRRLLSDVKSGEGLTFKQIT